MNKSVIIGGKHHSYSFDMSSLTVSFTGKSSVLQANFFPEILLDPDANYCCALLDFTSYNSIPNIVSGQNSDFVYKVKVKKKVKDENGQERVIDEFEERTITLPTSMYEVEDILKYLKLELRRFHISFTYDINEASATVQISFNPEVTWIGGTLLHVIGYKYKDNENSRQFEKNYLYNSDLIAKITNIDVIRIECDIVTGSYINGESCHTIHQFSHCKVPPGYKFIEVPQHIVYLPIKEKRLRSIQISVVDQDNKLIDFRGEQISCRIHIKKSDY